MTANHIGAWIDALQQAGEYSFARHEALQSRTRTAEAVKKSLQRLIKSKRIAKVTDSFFAIVPTEYVSAGSPPASWFIDQLMNSKGQPYYVGLLSAAAIHGASHHLSQEFQVFTIAPARPLKVGRQRIRFFTKRTLVRMPTIQVKTPTGMMRVSTPEITAMDLVCFFRAAGFLNHVTTVLHDLTDALNADQLVEAARIYGEVPTIQRLGYILDHIGATELARPLSKWIASKRTRSVPLRPDRPTGNCARDPRWNLLENQKVEVEY